MQPGSVLSDATIRRLIAEGRVKIEPWDPTMVQPASVDVRLGDSFRVFHNHRIQSIDLQTPPSELTEHVRVDEDGQFVIHPNEFVLGRTVEWVELPNDVVARIEGKALALDTPVPTPSGWSTMGKLRRGHRVFGPDGRAYRVTDTTEPLTGRPCYEVEFSDGTKVVADAKHQWNVRSRRFRPPVDEVVRTERIATEVRNGQEHRYRVPQCAPVQYPEKDLPVDPYVFGALIGDGTSTQANLTCLDDHVLREVEFAGYAVEARGQEGRYRIGGAPRVRDRATGRSRVLGEKRIPDDYLQGSVAQRQALLEGLMDTDGYCDKWGRCELTTVKRGLAWQYRELVASLGFRPVMATKTATLNGKTCGLKYAVTFTPDRPVFRLPRKLARQKRAGSFNHGRAIVAVREVPSVPVRCIQVDNPWGTFLVSQSFITTHNSSLGRLGLIVHATAGFVDPGFKGSLTLEIANFNSVPIVLRPGLPIAQLSFMALDREAERPYGHPDLGSHYYGQEEATESRYEGGPAARRAATPSE